MVLLQLQAIHIQFGGTRISLSGGIPEHEYYTEDIDHSIQHGESQHGNYSRLSRSLFPSGRAHFQNQKA